MHATMEKFGMLLLFWAAFFSRGATVHTNIRCPPGQTMVYCFVNPCEVTSCPAFPTATCVADYCGGCNARFFFRRWEVTKKCNICALPPKTGPCRGYFLRFFHNDTSQLCEPFIYGGCRRNSNNFVTLRQCAARCGCPDGKDLVNCFVDPCQVTSCPAFPTATCEADYCGGCNARFFLRGREVTSKCDICALPPDPGPCRAFFPRFFHNDTSGRCELFIYGGCRGNQNNFGSLQQCVSRCGCPDGQDPVNCIVNPCEVTSCPGFPTATCEADFCGGCNARFFQRGREVTNKCNICALPPDPGPCEALIPRFFHNDTSGRCESFIYGGCEGNQNNFESLQQCVSRCGCPDGQDRVNCFVNPCRFASCPAFPTATCEADFCGGCNARFFLRGREVTNKCAPSDICSLLPDPGPCDAAIPRFFHNDTSERCEPFVYGGCAGNQNNFKSLQQCIARCGCPDGKDLVNCLVDPCQVNSCPAIPTAACEADYCGGCNARFFLGGKEVTNKCDICALPPDPGPCRAFIPRFFHNNTSGRCERFIYGGCRGNQNNFGSLQQCVSRCGCPDGQDPVNCIVNPCEVTSCPGFPTATCEANFCGGCNARFFLGGKEVTNKCDICALPPDPGPCRAFIPRFFHNDTSGRCELFIYGGCRGNQNNFGSLQQCVSRCGCPDGQDPVNCIVNPCEVTPCPGFPTATCEADFCGGCNARFFLRGKEVTNKCNICALPPDPGPCEALIPRFFHNDTSGRCESFIYGGCEGNQNNFESLQQCVSRCGCPDGQDRVNCFVDPCRFASCPGFPTATCEADFCGGCNARFFLRGREVTKKCKCPIEGQVFQGCRTCPATCANPGLICIAVCQEGCGCPPGQLIDEITNRCVDPNQCKFSSST